jgi:hypothetical protein
VHCCHGPSQSRRQQVNYLPAACYLTFSGNDLAAVTDRNSYKYGFFRYDRARQGIKCTHNHRRPRSHNHEHYYGNIYYSTQSLLDADYRASTLDVLVPGSSASWIPRSYSTPQTTKARELCRSIENLVTMWRMKKSSTYVGVVHCVTRMAPAWHFRFKTTHVMSLTPLSSTKIYPPSAALAGASASVITCN